MVKVYGTHYKSKRYVKGYGHMTTYQKGNGIEEVAYEGAKAFAKQAVPTMKRLWKSLSPEARDAVIQGGVNLGVEGAKKLGSKISGLTSSLGETAEAKLGELIGKPESQKISKEAKNVIKTMLNQGKKQVREKAKEEIKMLGKEKLLTKQQRKDLRKGSKAVLSKLLAGRGLRLM